MTAFAYDHIHLRSPNAEETAQWYERMFGAEIIRSIQSDGRPRIDLNLGGVAVFIAQVPAEQAVGEPPQPPYLGLEHIGLRVEGIDAVVTELKQKGANSPSSQRPSGPACASPFCADRRTSTSSCSTAMPLDPVVRF